MLSDEKEKTLMSFVLENSGDLLSDLSFIKFACKRDPNMIKLASPKILYNTDSIYEILESLHYDTISSGYQKFGELIPEEIYNNPKIIIKFCKYDKKALEKANYDTRNNFNIVKEIVSTVDSYAYRNFKYATPTLN